MGPETKIASGIDENTADRARSEYPLDGADANRARVQQLKEKRGQVPGGEQQQDELQAGLGCGVRSADWASRHACASAEQNITMQWLGDNWRRQVSR